MCTVLLWSQQQQIQTRAASSMHSHLPYRVSGAAICGHQPINAPGSCRTSQALHSAPQRSAQGRSHSPVQLARSATRLGGSARHPGGHLPHEAARGARVVAHLAGGGAAASGARGRAGRPAQHPQQLVAIQALAQRVARVRQRAVAHPGAEHDQAVERLVHGHHVSRLVHAHERQRPHRPDLARGRALDLPHAVAGRRPLRHALPLERVHPPPVAHPVADEVQVARVDHHAHAVRHHVGQHAVKRVQPVTSHIHVDVGVARHPLAVAHPQRLARGGAVEEVIGVGEVVAQPARARLGDVVHVDGRVGRQDGLELGGHAVLQAQHTRERPVVLVAHPVGKVAQWVQERHDGPRRGADELVVQRKVAVRVELDGGVGEPVAHRQARQRDGGPLLVLVGQPHAVRHGRHVVARVALARDVQRALRQVGVHLVELPQEVQHVVSHALLVGHGVAVVVAVGEPRANGLVHKDHVVKRVPPELRLHQRLVGQRVGPVLVQHRQLAAAPGTARHPQHHGRGLRRLARLKVKVEHLSCIGAVKLEVASNTLGWIHDGHAQLVVGLERDGGLPNPV
mmetsp:Transcript_31447/g.80267  ORF Transcript_31447/g.80267 Transcript_31447/m.80267 type:complete len:567 (+) Transcript_31447:111-1811(+)